MLVTLHYWCMSASFLKQQVIWLLKSWICWFVDLVDNVSLWHESVKPIFNDTYFTLWNLCAVCDAMISKLVGISVHVCLQPYQGFGLLLIFVVVELVPSQYKPATVPSLDKPSLLSEPPTPDDIRPALPLNFCTGLTSAVLGTAVGHTLVIHYSNSTL